jgi:ketosteroid isomerase-like protein
MTATRSATEVVRSSYVAFVRRDRHTMEALLSDDFTFTSPYDDHIDKSTYFERCWPYGDTIHSLDILTLLESNGQAMVTYTVKRKEGASFRNAERLDVRDGKIVQVEVFFGALPSDASSQVDNGDDLAAIRALIERRGAALHSKDLAKLYEQVASESVAFDVVTPLQYVGVPEAKQRSRQWLGSFDGPVGYEVQELHLAAAGNVGFAHCLTRLSGITANGPLNMWIRSTTCFRKFDGVWKVVHEHNSVPFDPTSGKAALDLEP